MLSYFLRFVSGGSVHEKSTGCHGVSMSSYYRSVWHCALAICRVFTIHFPTSPIEIEEAVLGFQSISSVGDKLFNACIGALDGILIPICTPNKQESANLNRYFNGNHQKIGKILSLP